MCNLYHMSPRDDFEIYVRRHIGKLWLPEEPPRPIVGPFDTGMFLIPAGDGGLTGRLGQWGMIRAGQRERVEYKEYPSKKPGGQPRRESMLKNNARVETVASSPAFKDAWRGGRRCLIPALRLQEPNWQTGKCVWWQLRRADELPWMVGGIWSEWTDPESGELVNNYAMLTFNVDDHPLLNRLHRPEKDRVTGEVLPPEKQDKRGSAHIEPAHWTTWLQGSIDEAKALLVAPPAEFYDKSDAQRMDEMLTGISSQSVSQRGLIAGNT
ncbi:Putative SOS response-associated peptidase YedK [Mitsuaria sp. PDC51]|nr:Putative SOS response-associated peptidase YedK [Mitsuaria sp. PDC51]